MYLLSQGKKDSLGTADCFPTGGEHWYILSLIALFRLVYQYWSKSRQIICRIIPSQRNLSLTSVTGTQRLILAEELTSIRAGQMQKANYLTASTVFSRRTPESCINKTNYNTHTHKIVKLNLCLQANKKEPERVYVTVPSTDASHNNIGRIPNYSNKINK